MLVLLAAMAESLLESLITKFDTSLIAFDTQMALICDDPHISCSDLSALSSLISANVGHSKKRQHQQQHTMDNYEKQTFL